MPHFKSIFFLNKPKITLFLQKHKHFSVLGLCLQTPNSLQRAGAELPDPFPLLQISGHAPDTERVMLHTFKF